MVTIVVTACNRPDLLETTIETFLQYNTYPIKKWIISEDSGNSSVNSALMKRYPDFTWIHGKRGQIKSIDEAYALVETPYVLHWEEDWETYQGGFIEESISILDENPTVSAVMLRKYTDGGYTPGSPFLECGGGWGYYSFNPGLRRMSDYRKLFPNGFSGVVEFDPGNAHSAERRINDMFKNAGFKMALTGTDIGFVRHIGWDRHVLPKVGLCMIVKNESHIIHESLGCTLPLIDTYCIVDTGSTDNTIDIIKDFYADHGIHGEVHSRPWKDFGTNRSEALKLCDGKMEYILVIDADDLMTFPENGRALLHGYLEAKPSNMLVDIHQGTLRYNRSQVFKANDGWHYKGVLHEYPTNGKESKTERLPPEFWMESRRIGGRNKTGDKLLKDIEVLEKGVRDEPKNERYMFYLAQSYRDNGNIPKAIEWYKKRYDFGGWYEETYIAALNIAQMSHSKEWAWKAHEINPKRIECLVSYMSYCRAKNMWSQELYAMAKYATTIPKPADQMLFLETEIYEWKVWDEFSIIAYYTGHHDESKLASEKLIRSKFPEDQFPRIAANWRTSHPNSEFISDRVNKNSVIWNGMSFDAYWFGRYSGFFINGSISKSLKEICGRSKKLTTCIVTDSDGIFPEHLVQGLTGQNKSHIRSESYLDTMLSKVPTGSIPILGLLTTRNIYRENIIYLPLDDDTFEKGIDTVLSDLDKPIWNGRIPKVFWRGSITGSGIRQRVVSACENLQNTDVKFITNGNWVLPNDHLKYKYILIVDGACIASNHQWIFGSGSVPIMITDPGNMFWFKQYLKPMVNYVPVRCDLADLHEKIDWLSSHDDEAAKIAENALLFSKEVLSHEFQKKYIETEISRISNLVPSKIHQEHIRLRMKPSDINEHLYTLYRYAAECTSIIECGVRWITSSYAFADAIRKTPNHSYIMIDPEKFGNVDEFLKLCKTESINVKFLQESDITCERTKTDLLFIDTWHVYGQLVRELAYWNTYVNKYIILHDTVIDGEHGQAIRYNDDAGLLSKKTGIPVNEINKGIWPAVLEFLEANPEWKMIENYTNNNGLTVLSRTSIVE